MLPELTRETLYGTWHVLSVEHQNLETEVWHLTAEYNPGDYVWQFIPHGILNAECHTKPPTEPSFEANYKCHPGSILHFKGHSYRNQQRHTVVEEWFGVDWETENEIMLYNCDEDAELRPLRMKLRRVVCWPYEFTPRKSTPAW